MYLIEYTTTLNPNNSVLQLLPDDATRDYWFSEYLPSLQQVYGSNFLSLLKDVQIDLTSVDNLDDLSSFALAKKDLVIEHIIVRDEINSTMTSAEYDLIQSHVTDEDLDPSFDEEESEVVAEVRELL